ncbi:MAG TPA: YidC/Oxa1 family membrane protein insertase [Candidatus Paceibacterota bacterium]|nr:YidC/Oxa1 family membrane protein insertase [Candidatus Paceibacterota bacterium]
MIIVDFFKTILYIPLYNALVFLIHIVPGGEVGLAVIFLTFIVKLIIFPLSSKSIHSQALMREIEPQIKVIRAQKFDKQKEAAEIMEVYKKNKVNPFSGCFLLLIQLPIIISLYWVFLKGLPVINTSLLYSFTPVPGKLNMIFLGVLNLGKSSIILAALAGLTQFLQMSISLPKSEPKPKDGDQKTGFQEELTKMMNMQMKYILPVFIAGIAYTLNGAVALYWTTNNLFTVGQELWIRKERAMMKKKAAEEKEKSEEEKKK